MTYQYSNVSKRIFRSEIRELLKWTRKAGMISLSGGLPDPSLFPIEDIIGLTAEVLTEKGFLALQYGPTQGEPEMLEALTGHMREFGDEASVEQVCVTSSSQQGLDLLSLLFLDEGAPIIMELPSYLGAVQAFRRCGADMRGIPLDKDGMDIGYLQSVLDKMKKEGKKPRFIYTVPDFQNPSGITLSLERRHELLKIAAENEIPIVEDSPYRELSFTGGQGRHHAEDLFQDPLSRDEDGLARCRRPGHRQNRHAQTIRRPLYAVVQPAHPGRVHPAGKNETDHRKGHCLLQA